LHALEDHMRGHEQGLDHFSPDDQVRYGRFGTAGIRGTCSVPRWAFPADLIAGGLVLVLLIGRGVLGIALLAAAILLAIALFIRSVVRWRRDAVVAGAPPREPHLAEADHSEDARKQALRNFRFRSCLA
jgi:hypothetical protein